MCWWEDDDSVDAWELSGPNGRTLVEAQQEYAAERRPYRLRDGKVRPPRRHEMRDPDWRPFELTDDLVARVQQAYEAERRHWAEDRRLAAQEIESDPEGPFREYNAAVRALQSRARAMSHREVKTRMRELGRAHDVVLPEAYLELQSRLLTDKGFYRHHPLRAAGWLLRHGRPGTFRRRWHEVRSGSFRVAG